MSIVKPTSQRFTVESLAAPRRSLRIACVTETYPPEVNGVAGTLARMIQGLQQRNHEVQLIRPRQNAGQSPESAPGFHEVLMRGLPVPRYPSLRMGMPSKRALVQLWATIRAQGETAPAALAAGAVPLVPHSAGAGEESAASRSPSPAPAPQSRSPTPGAIP